MYVYECVRARTFGFSNAVNTVVPLIKTKHVDFTFQRRFPQSSLFLHASSSPLSFSSSFLFVLLNPHAAGDRSLNIRREGKLYKNTDKIKTRKVVKLRRQNVPGICVFLQVHYDYINEYFKYTVLCIQNIYLCMKEKKNQSQRMYFVPVYELLIHT